MVIDNNIIFIFFSINQIIAVLDPIFQEENEWKTAQSAILKLKDLLALVKDIINNGKNHGEDVSSLIQKIGGNTKDIASNFVDYEKNVTKALDIVYLILQDGVKLTNKVIQQHEDKMQM